MTDKEKRKNRAHSGPIDDLLGVTDQALKYLEGYRIGDPLPGKTELDTFLLIARTEYTKMNSRSDGYITLRDKLKEINDKAQASTMEALNEDEDMRFIAMPDGQLVVAHKDDIEQSQSWNEEAISDDMPIAFLEIDRNVSFVFPPQWLNPTRTSSELAKIYAPPEIGGMVMKHAAGDWGQIDPEIKAQNNRICEAVRAHHDNNQPLESFDIESLGGQIISVHQAKPSQLFVTIITTQEGTSLLLAKETDKGKE